MTRKEILNFSISLLKFKAITPFIDAVTRGMFCSCYFVKDVLCDVVPADMVRQDIFCFILKPI